MVELLRVGQVQVIPHPRGVPDSWGGGGEWGSECAVMRKKIRRILTKLRRGYSKAADGGVTKWMLGGGEGEGHSSSSQRAQRSLVVQCKS